MCGKNCFSSVEVPCFDVYLSSKVTRSFLYPYNRWTHVVNEMKTHIFSYMKIRNLVYLLPCIQNKIKISGTIRYMLCVGKI